MTRRWIVGAIVTVMGIHPAVAGKLPWAKDEAAARKTANESNKLIMIDFYTDWCGWCKKLDSDTYSSDKVIRQAAQLVPLRVNAEKEGRALAQKYHIEGFPMILFIDKSGDVVGKIDGYLSPDEFVEEMTKIDGLYKDFDALQSTLKDHPDDGEANARYALHMAMREKLSQAESAIAKAEKAGYKGDFLVKGYNAIGDAYQGQFDPEQSGSTRQNLDRAIEAFKKADAAATNVADRAYAKISMAVCYDLKRDSTQAKKLAQEILTMRGAPDVIVDVAREMLKN